MTKKSLLTASSSTSMLLLLFCTSFVQLLVNANSNMVSITHRSSLNNNGGIWNDYSSGLNIVKSSTSNMNSYEDDDNDKDELQEDEYVTNFYRQKRTEKREELAAKISGTSVDDGNCHHSLDHYFDHDALMSKNYCQDDHGAW
mmetsp:Transcript_11905/g.19651  ORF Transcript_11905/g.19651 Transcript_11905/m.19651 type:complete len:143 (-) Transcript_11905:2156-2584(-)